MSRRIQTSTPGSREIAQARLRHLTRGVVLAVSGATVAIGILVAHEHPGASSQHKGTTTESGSTAGNGTSTGGSSSSSSGNSDNSGDTGSTGNTGNSGSTAPTASSSTPTVTSGGTSR
jgi:hypothetical protein